MKTNMQFHAKSKEIADFLNKIISENNIRAYGVVLFPQYYAAEITESLLDLQRDGIIMNWRIVVYIKLT